MKPFFLMLFLLFSTGLRGQISIDTRVPGPSRLNSNRVIASDEKLRHSTTIFVLHNNDYQHLAAFDSMLKNEWSITPYKII